MPGRRVQHGVYHRYGCEYSMILCCSRWSCNLFVMPEVFRKRFYWSFEKSPDQIVHIFFVHWDRFAENCSQSICQIYVPWHRWRILSTISPSASQCPLTLLLLLILIVVEVLLLFLLPLLLLSSLSSLGVDRVKLPVEE